MMKTVLVQFFLVALLSPFGVAIAGNDSNKWRIEVSEGAKSDGVITFGFTMEEDKYVVSVPIDDGVSENKIAKRIEKVLDDELPGDKFEVDRDDGEDVVVKKRFGEEDFGLEVIENTVKAVRIDLDKE